MVTEDFCSSEIVKLLKEKGFKCGATYSKGFVKDGDGFVGGLVRHEDDITHQRARKWLRKVHKIYADPIQQGNYGDNSIYYSYIVAQIIDGKSYIHRPISVVDKLSYEEADDAALKYALENLI